VTSSLSALRELQGSGDDDNPIWSFFAFGDDLEEELGSSRVAADVAEFVEAEQVEAGVAGDDAGELFGVGGLGEFVD
jgi:hypothetical protein